MALSQIFWRKMRNLNLNLDWNQTQSQSIARESSKRESASCMFPFPQKISISEPHSVKNLSSQRHTETLQGNLRLSGAANDDGRRQGLTRIQLKL